MAKTSKSGKSNRKAVTGGMYVIIVAIVLVIVCFFVYITGVLPKTVTGVKIFENLPDGSQSTIKNFSVLETNYHFKEVFDSYSQYGMVSEDLLDSIYSGEETYRDWLLRETATQLRTLALAERAAKQDSEFYATSKARDMAADGVTTLDFYAKMYGYPSGQQFLSTQYGTGMTKRAYIDFSSRELLIQEYAAYLQQFGATIVPTDDEVQARFDENPYQSYLVDYNSYFVQIRKDDDSIDVEKSKAEADKIAKATKDSASFRKAVMDYLTAKGDTEALAAYEDDADPTFSENTAYSAYMNDDVKAFLFSESEVGSVKVIEVETGAYVLYVADKKLNELKNVTYRTLTLSTGVKSDATAEEITAAAQKTVADAQAYCTQGMAPIDFYKIVKEHTKDSNEMMTGGYYAAATIDSFVPTEENPLDSSAVEAGQWLFEPDRKAGDIKIVVSEDQKTVTVFYFEANRPAWANAIRSEIISSNYADWNAALEANTPGYSVNSGLVKYLIY